MKNKEKGTVFFFNANMNKCNYFLDPWSGALYTIFNEILT